MDTLIKINGYLGNFDNIVGTLGLIVAVIGIIVGGIGCKNIVNANKKIKNMNSMNGNNQQAENINNYGVSTEVADYIAESKYKEQLVKTSKTINVIELLNDNHYFIPVTWNGTQEEYDKLKENGEIYNNVVYYVKDN